VRATTVAAEAIRSAQFAVHAVPVQSSRAFLHSIKELLPASVPIISVSKGLEVSGAGKRHKASYANEHKQIVPSTSFGSL
jgi:glycerol-3-phosphate dehydrogenase (NAD+)